MTICKYQLLLFFVALVFAETSCASKVVPASPTVQQEPPATAFIGTPEISNLLVQAENESVEEFVVRIAARRIINKRPCLIALSQMENKNNFWFGVSRDTKDMEKCWVYDLDSILQCRDEDVKNSLASKDNPIIFFAFAYSNAAESLYVLDYYRPWDEQDSTDGYRLVIELKGDKLVEKSLTSVY